MMARVGEMQTIYGSHSAIAPFRLLRPARIADAAGAHRDGAVCLAGGVDLVPALRAGLRAERIVSLGGIAALKTIERRDGVLRIGAGVTYACLAADPAIAAALPDLAAVWRGIANVRVRHAATVGGNVMAGNPQYDMLPALMALDAKLVFVRTTGQEEIVSADAEVLPQGILAFIDIPLTAERRFAMERGYKPALSVALCVEGGTVRVAIGCAYERALCRVVKRDSASAEALAGAFADSFPEPASDWIASGAYRRKLARVLVARRLHALMGR